MPLESQTFGLSRGLCSSRSAVGARMMVHVLEGVRVLELGQIIAGTYGGQILSDLGAEIIKVESPQGDLGRNPSVAHYRGESALFLTLNRNKKSIAIDLK